jgi:hypothetical protein
MKKGRKSLRTRNRSTPVAIVMRFQQVTIHYLRYVTGNKKLLPRSIGSPSGSDFRYNLVCNLLWSKQFCSYFKVGRLV